MANDPLDVGATERTPPKKNARHGVAPTATMQPPRPSGTPARPKASFSGPTVPQSLKRGRSPMAQDHHHSPESDAVSLRRLSLEPTTGNGDSATPSKKSRIEYDPTDHQAQPGFTSAAVDDASTGQAKAYLYHAHQFPGSNHLRISRSLRRRVLVKAKGVTRFLLLALTMRRTSLLLQSTSHVSETSRFYSKRFPRG